MRGTLAVATILIVLATVFAPHTHGGALGSHACAACVTAGSEQATEATPEPRPAPPIATVVAGDAGPAPVVGAPLGAIPGQSPPARC